MKTPKSILRLFSRRNSQPEPHTILTSQSPTTSHNPLISQSPEETPTSTMRQANIFPRALNPPRECNNKCRQYNKVSCKRFCFQCGHQEHIVVASHSLAMQNGSGFGLDGASKCREKLNGKWFGKCGDVGEFKKILEFECLCCRRVWKAEASFRK
jgi:hypothetical protein